MENVDVENHRAPATPANMGLLVAHLDAAYNLARWLLRNMADAEDAVQEAYLRAFRSFEGFQGGEGRAWLLTIVRNSCYDRLRRIPRNTDMFDERMHFAGQNTLDPESSLLRRERAEQLTRAVEELPPQFREVLVLREFEEMSYKQIADVVEIPLGTVMSRLSRARQQLQQTVFAEDGTPETV